MRKIKPLNKLLENKLAWITSIRRDQTDIRAKANSFEYDNKFKLGKINPLIKWSKSDVWQFIHENKVPYNPLLDQGYDSIGCEPCTKPGTDRQGRWAGKDKIECGLHLQDSDMDQGGEFVI
jgi:phosphoadenosine phosphosulfate reductase